MANLKSRWLLGLGAFVLGSLVTLGVLAVVLFTFFWGWQERGSPETERSPTVYAREEFATLVKGKTEAEVEQAIGKPDQTSEDTEATYWHYHKRTRDPVTGGTDSDLQVVFQNGKVVDLNY
jgi:hypothetical protein